MSYRANGPIGMPNSFAARSIALSWAPSANQFQRLVQEGQQQAVDQKARPVADHDRRLADALGIGHGRGHGFVAGLPAANHFDQRHLPHGIEEVDAAEPLGPLESISQFGDRNGRGVRSQDRIRAHQRFEPGVDQLFDLFVFHDRLDDQVRLGQFGIRSGGIEQRGESHGALDVRTFASACCTKPLPALAARPWLAPVRPRRSGPPTIRA